MVLKMPSATEQAIAYQAMNAIYRTEPVRDPAKEIMYGIVSGDYSPAEGYERNPRPLIGTDGSSVMDGYKTVVRGEDPNKAEKTGLLDVYALLTSSYSQN